MMTSITDTRFYEKQSTVGYFLNIFNELAYLQSPYSYTLGYGKLKNSTINWPPDFKEIIISSNVMVLCL